MGLEKIDKIALVVFSIVFAAFALWLTHVVGYWLGMIASMAIVPIACVCAAFHVSKMPRSSFACTALMIVIMMVVIVTCPLYVLIVGFLVSLVPFVAIAVYLWWRVEGVKRDATKRIEEQRAARLAAKAKE